jgi:hypothetical protein
VKFQNCINGAFAELNRQFILKKTMLNFDKTNIMKFATIDETCIVLNISCGNKTVDEIL